MKTLYECKVEYLYEHGFSGHIKNVNELYRRLYNNNRGKSATRRFKEQSQLNDKFLTSAV